MTTKRKDKKGRILRTGESQRGDGRYEYKYTDAQGKRHSVYSCRLTKTDPVPPGGDANELPLREKEEEIQTNKFDFDVDCDMTVSQYFERYLKSKKNVRVLTLQGYISVYKLHIAPFIGNKKIKNIKYSSIVSYYSLLLDEGRSKQLLYHLNTHLSAVMKMAIRDGCISRNPCDGALKAVVGKFSTPRRNALTEEQQSCFLRLLDQEQNKYYKPISMFLLGTGCRYSEAAALQWEDCDFVNNVIHINKGIHRYAIAPDERKHHIDPVKTEAGNRDIPMLDYVRDLLLKLKQIQQETGVVQPDIDGCHSFVFLNKKQFILNNNTYDKKLSSMIQNYNKEEAVSAEKEQRTPFFMPIITAHILRHTFCTRLCEVENNIKVIQAILGHDDAGTTLNIYSETSPKYIFAGMKKLNQHLSGFGN